MVINGSENRVVTYKAWGSDSDLKSLSSNHQHRQGFFLTNLQFYKFAKLFSFVIQNCLIRFFLLFLWMKIKFCWNNYVIFHKKNQENPKGKTCASAVNQVQYPLSNFVALCGKSLKFISLKNILIFSCSRGCS